MIVGVPKESFPTETRVALVPQLVAFLAKKGIEVTIESGAGDAAGYPDAAFADKGAKIAGSRAEVFQKAKVIAQVRAGGANPEAGKADLSNYQPEQLVIAMLDPLTNPQAIQELAGTKATGFALELVPRITRAQSMDVLSSMATIAGYKAIALATNTLPKMFPMMMTAAGTVAPAKVLVIGAGVAGLQAIASARRNGAVVFGYDIRPAVKEQVESLGAKFVELDLETGTSEDKGGYAKAMGEDFYRRQQELMGEVVAEADVVVTTAAVPGKKAPILVTEAMVKKMKPGSVIVDIAAERGGNCELTKPAQDVVAHGVTILGPTNIPATIPFHASQMYAKNVATFLLNLLDKEGNLKVDLDDEIVRDSMVSQAGEVTNDRVRELLGLPAQASAAGDDAAAEAAGEGSSES